MTFLNAILLGGLVAGAIPIIIHILNKRRYKVVKWGAMHLLEDIFRTRRRRLKLEQLLLLLTRMLIIMLLAFCMARPVLTGMEALVGKSKSSVVLLVDDSYSMNVDDGGRSRFDRARREASRIVERLPEGSEVTLAWMSGRDGLSIEPTVNRGSVTETLAETLRGFGTARVPTSLDVSQGLFSRARYADRRLVVLTDFQRCSWTPEAASARTRPLQLMQELDLPPDVALFRIGEEEKDNVAVIALDLSRDVLGIRQRANVRATIKNFGTVREDNLRVYFRVDGEERDVSQISIGAGQSGQVLFSHRFEEPGSHVLEVRVDADSLEEDNAMMVSVPVWEKLRVLLVDGDTGTGFLDNETAFLEIALNPYTIAGRRDAADLVAATAKKPEELTAEDFAQSQVIIMADVPRLRDDHAARLADFVRKGGGLMIYLGDRIENGWYNRVLGGEGGLGLLPCRIGGIVDTRERNTAAITVVNRHFEHPALAIFNDPANGSLATARILLWYNLVAFPEAGGMKPNVIAGLTNGDPFLVEKEFGKGRVILSAVPCDDSWSDFPRRRSYLQLNQQLVTYLASTIFPPRNIEVGNRIAAFLPIDAVGKTGVLTGPDGRKRKLPVMNQDGARGLVEFEDTIIPGLYVLETPAGEVLHYVVKTSRKESDLSLLDEEEFEELADEMGATPVTSGEEYRRLDEQRRFGREIWHILIWFVVALVFLELYMQYRFGREGTV